jgi:hypothetical protein
MGQNHQYSALDVPEAVARLKGKLPGVDLSSFIFHVGNNNWYKNRLGVLRIYKALTGIMPDAPPLIMAGKRFFPDMTAFVESAGLAGRVFSLVDVSNEDLRALYSAASLLLFPSLAEGFGWPIIEAQACGCRVVTSGRAPMTEVGGDAAIYVDPEKETEAAETVRAVLQQDSAQKAPKGLKMRTGFRRSGWFLNTSTFTGNSFPRHEVSFRSPKTAFPANREPDQGDQRAFHLQRLPGDPSREEILGGRSRLWGGSVRAYRSASCLGGFLIRHGHRYPRAAPAAFALHPAHPGGLE